MPKSPARSTTFAPRPAFPSASCQARWHQCLCHLPARGRDYEGHSLFMLKRIAEALDKRVEIRFVPIRRKQLQPA